MILLAVYFLIIALYNPTINDLNLSNYFLIFWFLVFLLVKHVEFEVFSINRGNTVVIFLFLLYLLMTLFYSTDQINSILILIKLVIPFIFGSLLLNTIKTKKDFRAFVNIVVCSGIFASVYGCIQYFFQLSNYALQSIDGRLIYRATGAFKQPNVFASFLVFIVPFMIYKIKTTENKFSKFIGISSLLIMLICLYLTYSRWAIISLITVFAAYLVRRIIYQIHSKRFKVNFKVLLSLPVVLGISIYLLNKYSNTVYLLFVDRQSNDLRQESLMYAIEKFKTNILGFGLGNGSEGLVMDSSYVNLMIDAGIIGILLFIFFISTLYIGIKRLSNNNVALDNIYNATSISLFIFILNGALETIVYNSVVNIFLGIYLFILNADKRIFEE